MKSSISPRLVAAAALAVAGFGAVSAAHARSDVFFSIGLQGAPMYMEPAPVYVQPRPVYVQPRPVYVQPRSVYVQTYPGYSQYQYRDGWAFDRHGNRHHRQAQRTGPNGDLDRDGVINRYDRDRDGDGVPNRLDRQPNNGYRY